MTIGILAVQGDFRKHIEVLDNLGISRLEIRNGEALNSIDGLIIPGGESTTIHKLLVKGNFFAEAREFALRKPVFGTCAGAIMLSRELDTNNGLETLGAIDIRIRRNAYGRQVDSFIDEVEFMGERIEAVFIRAAKIINT
jgi:5'-phosphate synthase pdxT subunit